MKSADQLTIMVIIEYLKLDSYKLVENLAKVTNSENASNIIAYRDGALGRNQALIERLQKLQKKPAFTNRIEGIQEEIVQKKKAK